MVAVLPAEVRLRGGLVLLVLGLQRAQGASRLGQWGVEECSGVLQRRQHRAGKHGEQDLA
jgi:hypothetical protein